MTKLLIWTKQSKMKQEQKLKDVPHARKSATEAEQKLRENR